jgi:hypothetical protein
MRGTRRLIVAAALLVVLLAPACERIAPPALVRDGAGLFSEGARTDAEARLRAVATDHGIWAFVITDPVGDPPRMLDAPMQEADRQRVRAVAILFSDERVVGGGYSAVSADRGDSLAFLPTDVDDLLAVGDNDAALERTVDFLVEWAATAPDAQEPAPRPPVVGPTG